MVLRGSMRLMMMPGQCIGGRNILRRDEKEWEVEGRSRIFKGGPIHSI